MKKQFTKSQYVIVAFYLMLSTYQLIAESPDRVMDDFLANYCFDCHDQDVQKGKLNLEDLIYDINNENHESWDRAFKNIWYERMPPREKKKQPSFEERLAFLNALNQKQTGNELHTLRLRPKEVEYALEDLFEMELDISDRFQQNKGHFNRSYYAKDYSKEDWGELSGVLYEIIERLDRDEEKIFKKSQHLITGGRGGSLVPAKDKSYMIINKTAVAPAGVVDPYYLNGFEAEYEGRYQVKVNMQKLRSDDDSVFLLIYKGIRGSVAANNDQEAFKILDVENDKKEVSFHIWLKEGENLAFYGQHKSFFVNKEKNKKDLNLTKDSQGILLYPVQLQGPLPGLSQVTNPLKELYASKKPLPFLRSYLQGLAKKAYRRDVSVGELKRIINLKDLKYKTSEDRKEAFLLGLKRVILSPSFLFKDVKSSKHDKTLQELSLFLWGSPIIEESSKLAEGLNLSNDKDKSTLVQSMIKHKYHKRFVSLWIESWLHLKDFNEKVPDLALYPEFDEILKFQMPIETYEYLNYIYQNDHPLREMVNSDYVMLSERLANHYKMGNVKGSDIRKVSVEPASYRGGVITQASILTMTNDGVETSPILRGMWVLEKILGVEMVLPKVEVPASEPDTRGATTLRQQLEKHRSDQACASCHKVIDPPGFVLERFDVIGQFRNTYRKPTVDFGKTTFRYKREGYFKAGLKVNDKSTTLDGEDCKDVRDYKKYLIRNLHLVEQCVVEKLVEMSSGRKVTWDKKLKIQKFLNQPEIKDHGFQNLVKHLATKNWIY